MRRFALWTLAAAVFFGLCGPAGADEVEDLVKKLDPPRRFADYSPNWSVQKKAFTFEHYGDKQQTWDFWAIKDGDRYVALIPLPGFHSGTIYLLANDPAKAPEKLDMPTERWHIDTAIGTELRTDLYIPQSEGSKEETYSFKKDGEKLILTRDWEGKAKFRKWAHKVKNREETVDVTNTFVFKVDPVFGYMVDAEYDVRVSPKPWGAEPCSLATAGRYSLWPGTETCYRSVHTPKGSDGYRGYYLNLAAIASAGGKYNLRAGGFGTYLNDKTGWSSCITTADDARIVVCNAHADLDYVINWDKDSKADDKGMHRKVFKHRLMYLPPELTKHVWDKMQVDHQGKHKVQIRIGEKETFEDQPLPYTTRVRGLSFVHHDPEITAEHAHSGKRSMVVKGRVWPEVPQLNLQPNTKYVVEAWIKIEPWSKEQIEQENAKRKAKVEQDNAKRKKKGKPLREFKPIGKPEAYIVGDLYEWTPHSRQWTTEQKTTSATPGGDEWQHVKLEFTSPKWGPFINIAFVANAATAYVDDLHIRAVEDKEDK
ncbi:MAG: hypothetical protein ACLFVU_05950 [Phycisphaerae bacterium]